MVKVSGTGSDIFEKVVEMVAEVFSLDHSRVTPDLRFGVINKWDSLGHINLMLDMEVRFGVDIPPEAIATLLSVKDICAWLKDGGR